jgi:hypothetical protein
LTDPRWRVKLKQLAWFVALWLSGVVVVSTVAFAIRWWLR